MRYFLTIIVCVFVMVFGAEAQLRTVGLLEYDKSVSEGYTLFSPLA